MRLNRENEKWLKIKFPNIKPIKKMPDLTGYNGIGGNLIGKFEFDKDTQSYKKYHVFSFVYIPLIILKGFRVIDSKDGGWYFIGEEELGKWAKVWNFSLIFVFIGFIYWLTFATYFGSTEYKTNKLLEKALLFKKDGDLEKALRQYFEITKDITLDSTIAKKSYQDIINDDVIKLNPIEAKKCFQFCCIESKNNNFLVPEKELVLNLGRKIIHQYKSISPEYTYDIYEYLTNWLDNNKEIETEKYMFAIDSYKKNPKFLPFVIAKSNEEIKNKNLEYSQNNLEYIKSELGASEGANLLGYIYYEKKEYDQAFKILQPYIDVKLKDYIAAEKRLNNVYEIEMNRIKFAFRTGDAGLQWYKKFKLATKQEQEIMINNYYELKINASKLYQSAKNDYLGFKELVPAIIRACHSIINITKKESDEIKKTKLIEAENLLFKIKKIAISSDHFLNTYSEVLFLLGKQKKVNNLSEEFIFENENKLEALLIVARLHKQLGDFFQAKEYFKQAYELERDGEKKKNIASEIELLSKD